MLRLVILVLALGCVTLCSHIQREYYLIEEIKNWEEAQSYCRENYTDLATIGSHDDMKRLVDMTAASGERRPVWIGLKKTGLTSSWLWPVGGTRTSHGVAEYTNWASLPDSSHHCGGMRGNDGKWLSALCETTLPFVCQEDEGSSAVHVVLEEKSWRKAQEHCRLNDTDLASVMSLTENQALQQIVKEHELSLVWIGLFRDEWKWSDQSDSSFRYWEGSQPNNDGVCTLYGQSSKAWYDRGCTYKYPFYCYIEKNVMTQIVRVEITSNSFSDFSDSAVSKAILNQIQRKIQHVKLRWKVQPDGRIFRKKATKTIIEGCGMK